MSEYLRITNQLVYLVRACEALIEYRDSVYEPDMSVAELMDLMQPIALALDEIEGRVSDVSS